MPGLVVSHDGQLDYEGELCIIIGKTGKDIPEDKALEFIAGYATGNDVSSRRWQRDPSYAGSVPQWCFAKGFDKWCPLGPMLVSPTVCMHCELLSLYLKTSASASKGPETNFISSLALRTASI